ncbi:MAG: AAA family ATPase, partial [Solirubrobacteraceae bacterium]
MFGRELERARIEDMLDRVSGGPIGIVLEGAAGIGKTTLWREAVAGARRRGYRVLVAAPSEAEADLSFTGLGDLFDGLRPEGMAGLPEPQRRALAAALFVGDAGDAPADPGAVPRGVLGVLRALVAEAPVVVAIDDEQWLDRASARVLAFALRRIRDDPVCLLLARRTDSEGALWPAIQHSFASGVEVIVVSPLDVRATGRLVTERMASKVPRRVVQRVYEISGGNPLYILALCSGLTGNASPQGGRELPIPGTLSDAVARRLAKVPGGVQGPLCAVAALAHPTVGSLGAAFDGFDPGDLEEAVSAGVIEIAGEEIRFTHPLLASVHYASVPARERQKLHLRLAEAVPDAEERALHLALGTLAPDEQVAGELEHAAALAARRGAPEAAGEFLQHAVRLTPTDLQQVRWERTAAAADQHYVAGDVAQVRGLLEPLLLEQPGGRISAR